MISSALYFLFSRLIGLLAVALRYLMLVERLFALPKWPNQ
jgi:hypothetical protein